MKKFTVAILLALFLVSNATALDPVSGGEFATYDEKGAFLLMNAFVFDGEEDPTVSVFCNKNEVSWPDSEGGDSQGPDCPAEDTAPMIDHTGEKYDRQEPYDTDAAEMKMCGSWLNVEIVDHTDRYIVYDAKFNGQTPMDIGCSLGLNEGITFESTTQDCNVLGDSSCSKTAGSIIVGQVSAENLLVNMNTGGTFKPYGGSGDLNNFQLTYISSAEPGEIVAKEYDTSGGPDIDMREFKRGYVLDSQSRDLWQALKNPPKDSQDDCNYLTASGTCSVFAIDFTKDTSSNGADEEDEGSVDVRRCDGEKKDSWVCPPVYNRQDRQVYYQPYGGIIVGREYSNFTEPDDGESAPADQTVADSTKFHLCIGGVESAEGKTVFSSEDNQLDEGELFKCSPNSGTWQEVTVCSDGVDNDGDGTVDLNDPGCEGSQAFGADEMPEGDKPAANCPDQAVITREVEPMDGVTYEETGVAWEQGQGDLVSFINSDGELCEYGNFSAKTVLPSGSHEPDLFTCASDGTIDSDAAGNGFSDAEFETNNNFLLNVRDFCGRVSSDVSDSHGEKVPASVYFIPEETIPTTQENPLAAQNYIDMHVLSDGSAVYRLKTYKFQTLHDAEKKYGDYDTVQDCLQTYQDIPDANGEVCWHNNESLAETAPLMKDLTDGYIIEGSSPNSDPLESFGIANPGANNDLVSSDPIIGLESITDGGTDPVFDGGFAPECEKEDKQRWTFIRDEWTCSGAINNWEQVVMVPDISATDTTNYTIGMAIMPYNVLREEDDLDTAIDDLESSTELDLEGIRTYQQAQFDEIPEVTSLSDSPKLKQVNAKCYPAGKPGAKDWKTVEINIHDPTNPTPIAFWWESVDMSGISEFRCEWEYVRSDGLTVSKEGYSFDIVEEDAGDQDKRKALRDLFSGSNPDFDGYNGIKETYEVNPKDGGGFNEEFKEQAKKWANTDFYTIGWQ